MNRLRFAFAAGMLLISACADPEAARGALERAGYTNIETHGWAFGACSDEDFSSTKFTARNARGTRVEGVVCCGALVKVCSIKF